MEVRKEEATRSTGLSRFFFEFSFYLPRKKTRTFIVRHTFVCRTRIFGADRTVILPCIHTYHCVAKSRTAAETGRIDLIPSLEKGQIIQNA